LRGKFAKIFSRDGTPSDSVIFSATYFSHFLITLGQTDTANSASRWKQGMIPVVVDQVEDVVLPVANDSMRATSFAGELVERFRVDFVPAANFIKHFPVRVRNRSKSKRMAMRTFQQFLPCDSVAFNF
jgi:hypothetical protein